MTKDIVWTPEIVNAWFNSTGLSQRQVADLLKIGRTTFSSMLEEGANRMRAHLMASLGFSMGVRFERTSIHQDEDGKFRQGATVTSIRTGGGRLELAWGGPGDGGWPTLPVNEHYDTAMSMFRFLRTELDTDWTLIQEIRDPSAPNSRRQEVLSKSVSPEKVGQVIAHMEVDVRAVGSPSEQLTSFLTESLDFRRWLASDYDREQVILSHDAYTMPYVKKIHEDFDLEMDELLAAVHYYMINGPLAPVIEDLSLTLGDVASWLSRNGGAKDRLEMAFEKYRPSS